MLDRLGGLPVLHRQPEFAVRVRRLAVGVRIYRPTPA